MVSEDQTQLFHASRNVRLDKEEEDQRKDDPAFLERQLVDNRTLMVHGPISDKLAKHVTERLLAMEAKDSEAPITVFINSPGGSADSGFAIYDILRFVACPIRTVVNGLCASAGILVHLAGDDGSRYAMPESRFMIHQPSTAGQGTASDLDITAREVIKLRKRYMKIICDHTGQPEDQVLEDARRDFWLNSTEALEYKLIDKIIEKRSDLPL